MNIKVESGNRLFNWSAVIGAISLLGMFATNVITVNVGIAHNKVVSEHNTDMIEQNRQAILIHQQEFNTNLTRMNGKLDRMMELMIEDANLDRNDR